MKKAVFAAILIIVAAILAGSIIGLYIFNQPAANGDSFRVLATFYTLYDFAQNIVGDRTNVTILVPETLDVHDFDPTPSDIAEVASADVLIYNGAGLEPWIEQIVASSGNTHLTLVDSSAGIELVFVSSQFQRNNRTVDPHVWLDPILAKQQVDNILEGLTQASPENSQYFSQNAEAYKAQLEDLNAQAKTATTNTATRYFVTFHEAFVYFANRYNLTQIPIVGPFQEEPSPSDIQNVINAINQYRLLYVGYESLENPALPESVSSQTNATLIEMNPIEGLTAEEKATGDNYYTIMQKLIANIGLALSDVGSS